jgi:GTPase SAR1 family protein
LWDLQGQDRVVGGINKLFCKGASGALVVGDITDEGSIENTVNWKN